MFICAKKKFSVLILTFLIFILPFFNYFHAVVHSFHDADHIPHEEHFVTEEYTSYTPINILDYKCGECEYFFQSIIFFSDINKKLNLVLLKNSFKRIFLNFNSKIFSYSFKPPRLLTTG